MYLCMPGKYFCQYWGFFLKKISSGDRGFSGGLRYLVKITWPGDLKKQSDLKETVSTN